MRWVGAAYGITVFAFIGLAAVGDSELLFQYVTYVPLFIAGSIVVAVGLLISRHLYSSRFKTTAYLTSGITVLTIAPMLLLPSLPTSKCKAFYLASLQIRPGDSVMTARELLGPFDPKPPYEPKDDVISFRCESDPATVDYVMLKTRGQTVLSAKHLLD
jgi:hypothetical protein